VQGHAAGGLVQAQAKTGAEANDHLAGMVAGGGLARARQPPAVCLYGALPRLPPLVYASLPGRRDAGCKNIYLTGEAANWVDWRRV
jgi:hypothetical protein